MLKLIGRSQWRIPAEFKLELTAIIARKHRAIVVSQPDTFLSFLDEKSRTMETVDIGTTITSIAVAYFVFRWNSQKAQQELLRQKLEDLFVAVQNCGMVLTESVNDFLKDAKTADQTEQEIAKREADEPAVRKCRMLVSLYFRSPSVLEKLDKFMAGHKSTLDKLRREKKEDVKAALDDFHHAQQDLEKCLPDEASALLGPNLTRWFKTAHPFPGNTPR